jgi:hypothetical protein
MPNNKKVVLESEIVDFLRPNIENIRRLNLPPEQVAGNVTVEENLALRLGIMDDSSVCEFCLTNRVVLAKVVLKKKKK